MLSRLPEDLSSAAGTLFLRAVKDFNFDGADVDAARSRRELYALQRPLERKWGSLFSRKTVTSSQLLHMLVGVGSLNPAHARLSAYFLGFLDDRFERSDRSDNHPSTADDGIVAEFKLFLAAAAFAGTHKANLLVDA